MSHLSFPQLLCPFAIWITLVCFFTSICFATREGLRKLKQLHRIPCSGCAFSTGDYRLKCAVRPCQAFSEEAIHCLDFEQRLPTQWSAHLSTSILRMSSVSHKSYRLVIKQMGLSTQ